jgi:hypothetical protein
MQWSSFGNDAFDKEVDAEVDVVSEPDTLSSQGDVADDPAPVDEAVEEEVQPKPLRGAARAAQSGTKAPPVMFKSEKTDLRKNVGAANKARSGWGSTAPKKETKKFSAATSTAAPISSDDFIAQVRPTTPTCVRLRHR